MFKKIGFVVLVIIAILVITNLPESDQQQLVDQVSDKVSEQIKSSEKELPAPIVYPATPEKVAVKYIDMLLENEPGWDIFVHDSLIILDGDEGAITKTQFVNEITSEMQSLEKLNAQEILDFTAIFELDLNDKDNVGFANMLKARGFNPDLAKSYGFKPIKDGYEGVILILYPFEGQWKVIAQNR